MNKNISPVIESLKFEQLITIIPLGSIIYVTMYEDGAYSDLSEELYRVIEQMTVKSLYYAGDNRYYITVC